MVENTECLNNNPEDRNNNPEDRNNNPEDSKMVFVDYEIMNPNK